MLQAVTRQVKNGLLDVTWHTALLYPGEDVDYRSMQGCQQKKPWVSQILCAFELN